MATYFCTRFGAGNRDGLSPENAFQQTLVNWTTIAGSTIYMLDEFGGAAITPDASGTSNAVRTIIRGDYPGREATVNGTVDGFNIIGVSNITIMNFSSVHVPVVPVDIAGAVSNLTITNIVGSTVVEQAAIAIRYVGHGDNILIDGNTLTSNFDTISLTDDLAGDITNITISNNTIIDAGRDAIRAYIVGNTSTNTITGVIVSGNTITGTGKGSNPDWDSGNAARIGRNSIQNAARVSGVVIDNNTISDIGGFGLGTQFTDGSAITNNTCTTVSVNANGQGIGSYGDINFLIDNNYINGVDSSSAIADGHGIDIDFMLDAGDATYHIPGPGKVTSNKIYNCFGSQLAPGINLLSSNGIIVSGNLIVNCTNGMKIAIADWVISDIYQNNIVTNNTIIAGSNSLGAGLLFPDVGSANQATYDTNIITNNIIKDWPIAISAEAGSNDLTVDYSCCYGNTTNEQHDGTGAILSAGDITTDPLLNTDYTLDPSGPCYHAGTPIAFNLKDFKGHKFNIPPTIGAYEFTSRSAAKSGRTW